LCFRAEDGQTAIHALCDEGARVIAKPQPGEAFDDSLIAFLYLGFGLNIEIIDTDKRSAEIPRGD
jgi:methylmalonyl-CoA/ethylmalonyl-CoA epimerase